MAFLIPRFPSKTTGTPSLRKRVIFGGKPHDVVNVLRCTQTGTPDAVNCGGKKYSSKGCCLEFGREKNAARYDEKNACNLFTLITGLSVLWNE